MYTHKRTNARVHGKKWRDPNKLCSLACIKHIEQNFNPPHLQLLSLCNAELVVAQVEGSTNFKQNIATGRHFTDL